MHLKYALKNFNLLNFILLMSSLIFVHNFLYSRLNSNMTFIPSPRTTHTIEKDNAEPPNAQRLSLQDYMMIADRNLFHPERKIPSERKIDVISSRPEFVLFGTLITSDLSIAYIEDKKAPVSTAGRGQRQTTLMKGQSLSGFLLKEVMTDRVVMARGQEIITVSLGHPKSHKSGENPIAQNDQNQAFAASGMNPPLSKEAVTAPITRPDLSASTGTQPAWTQTVGTQPAVSSPSIGDATSTQTSYSRWKPFPSRRQYPVQ